MNARLQPPTALLRAFLALPFLGVLMAATRESERAFCVQLHLHGSFSEGSGSIDSQSRAAEGVVDVLWWSDHDFRVTSFHAVSTFAFEDWKAPSQRGEAWASLWSRERREKKRLVVHPKSRALAELTTEDAFEGEQSLRVNVRGKGASFRDYLYAFEADRNLQRRPLAADVTVRIAVKPVLNGPEGRAVIELQLSEHPLGGRARLAVHALRYFLDNEAEPFLKQATYHVPVRYVPGEWQVLELEVTRDATEGFPAFVGADNALSAISFGGEVREGQFIVQFDALEIVHGRPGEEMFEAQRALIEQVGREHPALVQLQGSEISYLPTHINEFSLDTDMPDYEALVKEFRVESGSADSESGLRAHVTRRAIENIHAQGGLASYNHLFGASVEDAKPTQAREELLEQLAENRLFGADLLEVGYRDRGGQSLEDHLWVWDRLAERGVFPVGTGVSDSHGVIRALPRVNDMVSWIYATSPTKRDLIEGLRRGRVFFGDPDLFDGTVDLLTPDGHRMGDVVVTEADEALVTILIDGLTPGQRVTIVGPNPAPEVLLVRERTLRHETRVALTAPVTSVRVEVRDTARSGVVFSNPILFARERELVAHLEGSGRLR